MLSDKKIQKISFMMTMLGTIGLYGITIHIEPGEIAVKDITENDIGKSVKIIAHLEKISVNKHAFFELGQENHTLKGVMFEQQVAKNPEVRQLKPNEVVMAAGKMTLYKGEIEIVADLLKPFKPQKEP